MCKVFSVSKSGFYDWTKRDHNLAKAEKFKLIRLIEQIHQRSRGTYGSPRVFKALKGLGQKVSQHKVEKIMKNNGIFSKTKRKFKELVISALKQAIARRDPSSGLIFHSDRGSQYCSAEFRQVLKNYQIMQSQSRKANCWDNACSE